VDGTIAKIDEKFRQIGWCSRSRADFKKKPRRAGPSLLGTDQTGTSDEPPMREHKLRSPRMFSSSAAAILARQDHCAERGPPKLSLCERAQSSRGGGETHVKEAPPPSPGVGASRCSQMKKPRGGAGPSW
jgi:hypothetical protein